jgi:hypothetical protein
MHINVCYSNCSRNYLFVIPAVIVIDIYMHSLVELKIKILNNYVFLHSVFLCVTWMIFPVTSDHFLK